KPEALSLITGSWDQGEHRHAGEVDLLRFLFPERPSFMINRHAVGAHRLAVLTRAQFNAAGLVVWQDVFGEVLPYTDAEAAQVRAIVAVLRRYAARFRGLDALPLVPTADPDLYANAFIGADGRAALTIYNAGPRPVQDELVTWPGIAGQRWARVAADGSPGDASTLPQGRIAPGMVATFVSAGR
ncbi:MAG TPA: hypothetical protein VHB98_12895, partial [Chloroflexota bacterium]|nr:hypothetical protein [Chloroflexota bacterium]